MVGYWFHTVNDRGALAKEIVTAFELADAQVLKITRRVTARVRHYARVFELVPAKK